MAIFTNRSIPTNFGGFNPDDLSWPLTIFGTPAGGAAVNNPLTVQVAVSGYLRTDYVGTSVRGIDLNTGLRGPEIMSDSVPATGLYSWVLQLDNGNFVSWRSESFKDETTPLVRVFTADGSATPLQIDGGAYRPAVTDVAAVTGGFVVSWQTFVTETRWDAHIQRFDVTGQAAGPVLDIVSRGDDKTFFAVQKDGIMAILHQVVYPSKVLAFTIAQADGAGPAQTVVLESVMDTSDCSVVALADGGFGVTWITHEWVDARENMTLWTQSFDADGTARHAATFVQAIRPDEGAILRLYDSKLVALVDGSYLLKWTAFEVVTVQDSASGYVHPENVLHTIVQRFTPDGQASGGKELLIGRTEIHSDPIGLGDGRVAVLWVEDTGDRMFQILDPRKSAVDLHGNAFGNDYVGTRWNDTMAGGVGDDRLDGSAGHDFLQGDDGRDELVGGIGRDTLVGGTGNDLLKAGAGNDRMTGGAGADRFVFGTSFGQDRITDFENGIDKLDLRAMHLTQADLAAATGHVDGGLTLTFGTDRILLWGVDALQTGDYLL